MNNRPVYFDDFFTTLLKDADKVFEKNLSYNCPSFPPVNVYSKEDKTIVYEFALAGYDKKDISLEFENNYMVLKLEKPKREDYGKIIYQKLKLSSDVKRYHLPSDKFFYDKAVATFKNGILLVEIPSKIPEKVLIGIE